jgi:hypothetical protein|tara:strand:+ start:1157 stop:1336 length:180 start_codon:yes stop_codon:yes gene_type:complete
MIIKITDAIISLNANAKVAVRNNTDIDNCEIDWLGGTSKISKTDIKTEQQRLQEIEDKK